MTTPTASPGIHELPEPCWTVVKPDGEGTGEDGAEYHFLTREKAEYDAGTYPAEMGVIVKQGEFRCWTATLRCGEEFVYEGDSDERHFADKADLLNSANLMGCQLAADGSLTCDDDGCEICKQALT